MEVVGLVSSCIAIGELAVKSLRLLHSLQQKVNYSGLHLQTVRTQISAVNAAVTHIQSWLDTCSGNPCMVEGLIGDLQLSLDGCKSLLEIFSEQATQVMKEQNTQGWIEKIKLVWNETDLTQYRDMLRDQVQALSLLLQVTYDDIQSLPRIVYSLGVEQTKLERLLLESKQDRRRQLHQNLARLGPVPPGTLKSLLSAFRTTAGLVELNRIYRFPYGLSPITLDDLNSFRRAWRICDPFATGYISQTQFPLLLRELEDPFSVRLYDPEFSIHRLLSGIDTTLAPPGSGPFLQILAGKLEKLPVSEVKRRRVVLDLLFNEVSVMLNPLRGIKFVSALVSILNFKRSTDADWRSASSRDVWLAVQQSSSTMLGAALRRHIRLIRAEEKRKIAVIIGFFDTLYWHQSHSNFLHLMTQIYL
ncbi:hypothetical protein AO1008_06657 [Aspergillus oryzae 100-8]|nr:hypothetical protein AO1008_06657 [Aspergillus oryzae 100-8]